MNHIFKIDHSIYAVIDLQYIIKLKLRNFFLLKYYFYFYFVPMYTFISFFSPSSYKVSEGDLWFVFAFWMYGASKLNITLYIFFFERHLIRMNGFRFDQMARIYLRFEVRETFNKNQQNMWIWNYIVCPCGRASHIMMVDKLTRSNETVYAIRCELSIRSINFELMCHTGYREKHGTMIFMKSTTIKEIWKL